MLGCKVDKNALRVPWVPSECAFGAHGLLRAVPLTINCWLEAPFGGGGVVGVLELAESPPPPPREVLLCRGPLRIRLPHAGCSTSSHGKAHHLVVYPPPSHLQALKIHCGFTLLPGRTPPRVRSGQCPVGEPPCPLGASEEGGHIPRPNVEEEET